MLLSELRATVTGASVDYVGSVTIHEELCDALGLLDRQMVHIRNNSSSSGAIDLWTYVIRGLDCFERCPPGTVCLNGAAAHLVHVGDIVTLTARGLVTIGSATTTSIVPRRWDAVQDGVTNVMTRMGGPPRDSWAAEAVIEYACGKVHRPRITHVVDINNTTNNTTDANDNNNNNTIGGSHFPALVLDSDWAQEGSIHEGEAIHLVNVTNGQRDIVTAQYAPAKSQQCALHNIINITTTTASCSTTPNNNNNNNNNKKQTSRPGYSVGDVVIAMTYGSITRGAVMEGKAPPMSICFPFERPVYMTTTTAQQETPVKSTGTASPPSPTSTCSESSSEGSTNTGHQQQVVGHDVDLHTLWEHSAKRKQQQELHL